MKGFVSFIAACAVYMLGGLIAWNIVCSMVDVPSMTLLELADYRIYTYSGLTLAIMLISFMFQGGDENAFWFVSFIIAVNAGIAIAVNHWEGIWPSVSIIFTIIYNIVNILFITLVIRMCFKDNK